MKSAMEFKKIIAIIELRIFFVNFVSFVAKIGFNGQTRL
jgi:hypothetical protein